MENAAIIEILRGCGSLLEGHFLLTSGKHSDRYCQCAKLLQYPDRAARAVEPVAAQAKALGATAVVGPAMGGIVVAYELARQLGIRGIFTERENDVMALRRGFEIAPGERVIISEDVVTTGKSTMEVAELLTREFGATVVGVCCLVDRRPEGVTLPLPIYSATELNVKTFEANDCPICREGSLPLVKPGSRKKI
ncbi:MAG: orotate phosphoribosyltransferase [Oscillospiraceae bacterium]|jgi:orotate phosphoribosyltransferase|nr:orotate phosphoribosyltransferase [Oscillospiraceae bacterium]